eukprot:714992-Karenia_brevis.AAC.1
MSWLIQQLCFSGLCTLLQFSIGKAMASFGDLGPNASTGLVHCTPTVLVELPDTQGTLPGSKTMRATSTRLNFRHEYISEWKALRRCTTLTPEHTSLCKFRSLSASDSQIFLLWI